MDTFDDEIFGRIRNIGEFRNDIAHTSAAPSYQELLNRNDYGGTIPLGTNTQGTESTGEDVSYGLIRLKLRFHIFNTTVFFYCIETVIMTLRERLREKEFELVDLKKDHEHLKKMHYSTVMALNALGTMTVEKKQMDKAKEIDVTLTLRIIELFSTFNTRILRKWWNNLWRDMFLRNFMTATCTQMRPK